MNRYRWLLLLLAPCLCCAARAEEVYQVGFGKVDITPRTALRLSGYGERTKPSTGVDEKIFVRAMAMHGSDAKLHLLVSVDTIGFPGSLTKSIAERIAKTHDVTRSRFVLCSSHSHTTPHLEGGLTNLLAVPLTKEEAEQTTQYTKHVADQVLQAVRLAIMDQQPARISIAEGEVGFARNRRIIVDGRHSEYGTHTHGARDLTLPVLKIADEGGKLRGVVYNYACHCTTLRGSDNRINGDWAGYASQEIEAQYPGATALCTIGCGADQDPQPDKSMSHAALAKAYGQQIASEVARLVAGDMREINAKVAASFGHAGLPFDLPPVEEFRQLTEHRRPQTRRHANNMLALRKRMGRLPETYPAPIHVWRFGDQLSMIFLGGEVVVDYALRLQREIDCQQVWVSAYCDDVFGYVASERIRREGGYEAVGSMVFYNQPGPWAEGTEDLLVRRIQELDKQGGSVGPLSAEASLEAFHLSPGFEIELLAAEPLIRDPVNFEVGADGRLWVVEMGDYPHGESEHRGRVKVLQDTNKDSKYDSAAVFLDALPFPNGVFPWRDGVLISCGEKILFARDSDGDQRADTTETLYSGFAKANPQHRAAGFSYGLDNWLYLSGGTKNGEVISHRTGEAVDLMGQDFRIEPNSGRIELVGGQTQFGRNRDDWGNWYGGDNSRPIYHYLIADRYLRRNPFVSASKTVVTVVKPEFAPPVFPVSNTADRFNDLQAANRFTSACSPSSVRDSRLGQGSDRWILVCEPVHNLVHRAVLVDEGTSFRAERHPDEQSSEFVASKDQWFRPTVAKTGPDGALWIADMYRHVIEHPEWIPEAWQTQLDLRAGDQKGRMYRVFPTNKPPDPIPDLNSLASEALVGELAHPNGWRRDTAQRLLVQRADRSVVGELAAMLQTSNALAKVHALGTLDGLGELTSAHLLAALNDTDCRVQCLAIELCESLLSQEPQLQDKLLELVSHSDQRVQLQLALSLGEWNDSRAADALVQLVVNGENDPIMQSAVLSSATQHCATILAGVVEQWDEKASFKNLVSSLIATAVGSGDREQIKRVIGVITPFDHEPASWQFEAIATLTQSLHRQNTEMSSLSSDDPAESSDYGKKIFAIVEAACRVATDSSAPIDHRLAAIPLLGRDSQGQELLGELLLAQEPLELQLAAVQGLALIDNARVPPLLLANCRSLSPQVQAAVLQALISRASWHEPLIKAMEAGEIRPVDIDAVIRSRLIDSDDSALGKRAAKVFADKQPAPTVDIGVLSSLIDGLAGDALRGSKLFTDKCATCHRHNEIGKDFGPKLAALSDKSTGKLLEAILDPNRAIESKYKSYTCLTADGRALQGMISAETSNSITLVQPNGAEQTLLRIDIEELQSNDVSFMPTGLDKGLTPQAFADLFTFLRQDDVVTK